MSNHLDRFHAAVSALAGHGNIKQRLIVAFEDHLADVESDEVPIAVKQSFADLRKMMSGVEPLNGEGRIRATVRKMSVIEADECAQKMIDLYTDIIRYEDQAQESLPLRIGDQPLLPPFLVKSG
ncbi:MAG: hypothetical protein ACR2Q3_15840 [Woeseiaceae bacterium]